MKFLKLLIFLFVLVGWSPNAIAFWGLAGDAKSLQGFPVEVPESADNGKFLQYIDASTEWILTTAVGTGDMTEAAYASGADGFIDADAGGTNIDTIAATGIPSINAGTWSVLNEATFKSTYNIEAGDDFQAWDADLDAYALITPSANIKTFLGAADYAAMLVQMALTIGTNTQAWDADLDAYALITTSANMKTFLAAADYAAMLVQMGLTVGSDVQAYDADTTKADVAETIAAQWDFSAVPLVDADIDTTLTLGLLKMTALTAEPTEVVGEIYRVNGGGAWDPLGRGGTTDYWVICTVAGTGEYVGLWTEAGEWLVSTVAAAMKVETIGAAANRNITAAQMNRVWWITGAGDQTLPDECDAEADWGQWITLMASAAHLISVDVAAAEDDFLLTDGTEIDGAANEVDLVTAVGSQATFMCVENNLWKVTGEIGTVADGSTDD